MGLCVLGGRPIGGLDNITAIIVHVIEAGPASDDVNRTAEIRTG